MMENTLQWKEIRRQDMELIRSIYKYYVDHSTATFHTGDITVDELSEIISLGHPKYKSYLIECAGELAGYCYFGQHKKRQAYDRTAELTIYLKPGFTGKGIGRRSVQRLEDEAQGKGIAVMLAVISGDNTSSIGLFERCGYAKCAHFSEVGEKFDKILDVVAYQKVLIPARKESRE